MSRSTDEMLAAARTIADDVLFPNALAADQAGVVPAMQLDCLVDAGLYGISTYCDRPTIAEFLEILAGGCLTTAFVWAQHLGATAGAFFSEGPVKAELAEDLVSGAKRGGVAFAHMLRAGEPLTTAEPAGDGWIFNGRAPWVTGWGHVDVVHAAARHGEDLVWGLIDAVDSPTLESAAVTFAVMNSTQTRVLAYRDHHVPESRITKVENYDQWRANYRLGLRANASLALGVAGRCCRLLDDSHFTAHLNLLRDQLNMAKPADYEALSGLRADVSLFAVHVATALVAKVGGNAVMMTEHAQRLFREAMFVMVQGQTPSIKSAMLDRLSPA